MKNYVKYTSQNHELDFSLEFAVDRYFGRIDTWLPLLVTLWFVYVLFNVSCLTRHLIFAIFM